MTTGLKDTTLRSLLFGKSDVEVTPDANGQMVLKEQVTPEQFNQYVLALNMMAQLSRAVYCDSGILREVLLSPSFGTENSSAVNKVISELGETYRPLRKQTSSYSNSKDGRPMQSYVIQESTKSGTGFARYVSSPSDLTFVAIPGPFKVLQQNDLVLCFKGSSTVKNFQHDLYSQFTPTDLATIMPPGTTMTSTTTNYVPKSFVMPLTESWQDLTKAIGDYAPTRLFVTGHSLGGAYATLFAFMVAECHTTSFPSLKSVHVITFGSPTLLGDGARNTFNAHLDSGFLTLDRVVSYASTTKVMDVIPSIPVGFSHPGFQPLRTEVYPEKKTGRAYNLDTIRKVYQKGGLFGFGSEKTSYESATKTHMPNKVIVPATSPLAQGFAHAEYMNMIWLRKAFREYGMKNPGFKASDGKFYTFTAELFDDGIRFQYTETGTPSTLVADPDATSAPTLGARRTLRKTKSRSKTKKTLSRKEQ